MTPFIDAVVANASIMIENDGSNSLNTILADINSENLIGAKTSILHLAKWMAARFKIMGNPGDKKKADGILADTQGITTQDRSSGVQLFKDQYGKLTLLYLTLHQKSISLKKEALESTGLPLGWTADWHRIHPPGAAWNWLLVLKKLCGLSLTIFLVSFGAPFWTNVMNALIGLKQITRR